MATDTRQTYAQKVLKDTKLFIAQHENHETEVFTNNCRQYATEFSAIVRRALDAMSRGEAIQQANVHWNMSNNFVNIAVQQPKINLKEGVNYYNGLISIDENEIFNVILIQEMEKLGFKIEQNNVDREYSSVPMLFKGSSGDKRTITLSINQL